ncbi:MAG: VCBS repeat-containing protein [Bacteroidia bacterium]
MTPFARFFVVVSALLLAACGQDTEAPLFRHLSPSRTGIDFVNALREGDSINILTYIYLYNGAGVGAGDFNNDGQTDLFFAGNMVSSRLYLNKGDLHFQDVSEAAGVQTRKWITGVSLVDIDQNGWLDVYLCAVHPHIDSAATNLLFINQGADADGVPHFVEAAAAYGLDDAGYSTQAAFFDYDLDGDLDCYLLTNALETDNRNNVRPIMVQGEARSTDRLYRNNGNGTFTNVSREAGITIEGWGLGVAIADINQDGWPDVYVANDFLSNDLLWINQQNGTFRNEIASHLKHSSYNGMGTDVADFNNDGLPDIAVLDMMPEDNRRQKSMFAKPNYEKFQLTQRSGYLPQFIRNTLQLNNGNGTFSEIGQMAGMYKTDWSWTPLFIDIDNDGLRDLVITNGYHRDVTDLDYAVYSKELGMFGTPEIVRAKLLEAAAALEGVKKHNYLYHNRGDLTFEDRSAAWGFTAETYSNGTAFADLDGDGDLDLVLNNINDPAFIYENRAAQRPDALHALRIRLEGSPGNRQGMGTKLWVTAGGQTQYHDHSVYRGYKSTMEQVIHFGLGRADSARVRVRWPDGREQVLDGVPANLPLSLRHSDARPPAPVDTTAQPPLLRAVAVPGIAAFAHREADYNDFNREHLLVHKYSQGGPALAAGDIDGDGRTDLAVAGSGGFPTTFFMQTDRGFVERRLLPDSLHEDMGLLLFDADGDGDTDLYAASGGNERRADDGYYQDRLYRNDGRGNLVRDTSALPDLRASSACVVAGDVDNDGDPDLFVGSRIVPGFFPQTPRSTFLRNDGGRFADATDEMDPALGTAGLVTAAVWTDYDNDGWQDLIVVGEYMAPRLFHNENGRLTAVSTGLPDNMEGWWTSILPCDYDRDGDMDYALGNLGLNTRFRASPEAPVCIYAKDYDSNGSIDPVMSYYIQGKPHVTHGRDVLIEQMLFMRRRFKRYYEYGQATLDEVLAPAEREGALLLRCVETRSGMLENLGEGRFAFHPFPNEAQIAPITGLVSCDLDLDGVPDLVATGNAYGTDPEIGWYDAGRGLVLRGDGTGGFAPLMIARSGLYVDGDAKALLRIPTAAGALLVASRNRGPLATYGHADRFVPAAPGERYAIQVFADGSRARVEWPQGAGYLSQEAPGVWMGAAQELHFYNNAGRARVIGRE